MKMNFDDLRKKNSERGDEWNGYIMTKEQELDDLSFRGLEMAGEAGEAANVLKKYARTRMGMVGGISFDDAKDKASDELADIIICVDRIAAVFDINLPDAIVKKFNKTSDKNGLLVKF